jgi:CHAD domain-containing protein
MLARRASEGYNIKMAFQLQIDESVGECVKRLVRRQLDKAHKSLRQSDERDQAIHDARQCFKKVRALLRLVRDELGEKVYREENRYFRDAARPLTAIRDATVLIETLDKLVDHFVEQISATAFGQVREALLADKRSVYKRVLGDEDAIAKVTAAAKSARSRIRDWPIAHEGWLALEPGLKRVYRNGCRALAGAFAEPSAQNMHEWRKQAKYLWHQLQVLEPIRAPILKGLCDQARQLSQLLGDDHDLTVLRQKIVADPEGFGGAVTVGSLTALIDRRRLELQSEAFQLAQRVYVDKPNRFTNRIKGYWKARHS